MAHSWSAEVVAYDWTADVAYVWSAEVAQFQSDEGVHDWIAEVPCKQVAAESIWAHGMMTHGHESHTSCPSCTHIHDVSSLLMTASEAWRGHEPAMANRCIMWHYSSPAAGGQAWGIDAWACMLSA